MRALALPTLALALSALLACDAIKPYQVDDEVDTAFDPDGDTDDEGGGGGGGGGGGSDTPDVQNVPPNANAGLDQFDVTVGETVLLDGSGSSDLDNDPLTYSWAVTFKPPGSFASIANPTFATAQFVPDRSGTYEITLTVTDGRGGTDTDLMRVGVEVENRPPVADAGPDQNVVLGQLVQISAAGSLDLDGDQLSYRWRMVSAPGAAQLSMAGGDINPRLTPDATGAWIIELIVNDGEYDSDPDLITINVSEQSTTTPGGSGGDDCLECAADPDTLRKSWSAGGAAHGLGLGALPVLLLFWRRRQDDQV